MIRYILVDDNPKVLEKVKAKIDALPKEYELQHIKSYDSSKKAYQEIKEKDYDLLIVDYEMPVYDGIELAQKIGSNKKIIFLTSTSNNEQKVINSLDISGFLSKPFDIEEFEQILKTKIISKINRKDDLITLKTGAIKNITFAPKQAYYISTSKNINGKQPDKNHVNIYGENDTVLFKNVYITITNLSKLLLAFNFKKINQSTIINLYYKKTQDNKHVSLHNCKETFVISDKEFKT